MTKPVRIVATVEFILHSDYEDETESAVAEAIVDSLQDERIGAAEYGSVSVTSVNVEPMES